MYECLGKSRDSEVMEMEMGKKKYLFMYNVSGKNAGISESIFARVQMIMSLVQIKKVNYLYVI